VVAASAGSPRTPSIEVGDYRRLPASRDEPQLGYLSEIQGDLGAPGAVGAAPFRGS
jgi:hypothetical protein